MRYRSSSKEVISSIFRNIVLAGLAESQGEKFLLTMKGIEIMRPFFVSVECYRQKLLKDFDWSSGHLEFARNFGTNISVLRHPDLYDQVSELVRELVGCGLLVEEASFFIGYYTYDVVAE